jgi:PEP-CTERM motif
MTMRMLRFGLLLAVLSVMTLGYVSSASADLILANPTTGDGSLAPNPVTDSSLSPISVPPDWSSPITSNGNEALFSDGRTSSPNSTLGNSDRLVGGASAGNLMSNTANSIGTVKVNFASSPVVIGSGIDNVNGGNASLSTGVPEPASLLLAGLGLAGLGLVARRKKHRLA